MSAPHHAVTRSSPSPSNASARISAFELRGGCGNAMVFLLCVGSMALASLLAPRRVWAAWRRARGLRSLYGHGVPLEALLELSVADLRHLLGIPPQGFADPRA